MSEQPCALCGYFKMKEYPDHAKVELGRCVGRASGRVDEINSFVPWSRRACERYMLAPNAVKRMAWIEKRKMSEQNNHAAQLQKKG